MYFPEFDALCHEVAGKLTELRRLVMETVVASDAQTELLAELTRLLRLVDATTSQSRHSLLGDVAAADHAFLAELRAELAQLTAPASPLHTPRPQAAPSTPIDLPPSPVAPSAGPTEVPVAPGMLHELYWDIQPVYPNDDRLLFAHNADWQFCLIVRDETGQIALLFDTEEARGAYLGEVFAEALERPDDDEPGAPVPALVPPHRPSPVASNARRLEEAGD